MAFNPEPAFAALFTRFEELKAPGGPFRTVSRRHPKGGPPDSAVQPALYLNGGDRRPTQELGRPTLWKRARAMATIYCFSPETESVAPLTQINALIAAVEGALEWRPLTDAARGDRYHTNLGGTLGVGCWISENDDTVIDEIQGEQGFAVIPIDLIWIS